MIPASVISRLATLGLSEGQAGEVASMLAEVETATEQKVGAELEARRASDRARKHKQRLLSRDFTGHHVTSGTNGSRARVLYGEESNISPSHPSDALPPSGADGGEKRKSENRGSRLPDGWQPDEELISFGISEGLSRGEVAATRDEFCDYWQGESGARAAKRDWRKTFRNRLREVASKKRRFAKTRPGPRGGGSGFSDMLDELRGQHGNGTNGIQENRTSGGGPARAPYSPDLSESPRSSSGVTYLDFGSQRAHIG